MNIIRNLMFASFIGATLIGGLFVVDIFVRVYGQ
jgi:hypothetical protein